jgi:hypothetical protein
MDLFITSKSWMRWATGSNQYSWRAASGTWGKLRVSMRDLDEKLTTGFERLFREKSVKSCRRAKSCLSISRWYPPAGCGIRDSSSGLKWRDDISVRTGLTAEMENPITTGNHIIHTGEKFDSWLQIQNCAKIQAAATPTAEQFQGRGTLRPPSHLKKKRGKLHMTFTESLTGACQKRAK